MAVWLIAVFFVADNHASEALCKGMRIEVSDTSLRHFVTAREIARELGTLPQRSAGMRLADINTEEIGRRLAEIDKIESANVVKLAAGGKAGMDGTSQLTTPHRRSRPPEGGSSLFRQLCPL